MVLRCLATASADFAAGDRSSLVHGAGVVNPFGTVSATAVAGFFRKGALLIGQRKFLSSAGIQNETFPTPWFGGA